MPRDLEFLTDEAKRNLDLKRNLFVKYKSFPDGLFIKTSTQWQELSPQFNHKSQFPVILNQDLLTKLQNFGFTFEVWDTMSPSKDQVVGFC
jgi:hypothetical protein